MARKSKKQPLRIVHPRCAGIDIGSREHWVAVDPDSDDQPVRRFSSFSDDLHAMGHWLKSLDIEVVAIGSHRGVLDSPLRGPRCARISSQSGELTRYASGVGTQVRRPGLPVDLATDDLWPTQGGLSTRRRGVCATCCGPSARRQGQRTRALHPTHAEGPDADEHPVGQRGQ